MNDQDYREILQTMRRQVLAMGLGAVDERILSNLKGSEGPYWDLMYYLKHLREEVALGSDTQYRETLRRIRRYVQTDSGRPVEGIRIGFSPEEADRYQAAYIDIAPNPELGKIAEDLAALIDDLRKDHDQNAEGGNLRG